MSIQENVLKIKGYGEYLKREYTGHGKGVLALGITVIFLVGIGFYAGYTRSQSLQEREEGITFLPEEPLTIPCEKYPHIPQNQGAQPLIVPNNSSSATPHETQPYVASKNGKTYYPVSCSGARRIKEGNRVYFTSTSEAEQRGYTLSKTCK